MKVVLKSPALDLEVDDVKKLDDVLRFAQQYIKLQLEYEQARNKIQIEAALATNEALKPKAARKKKL